MLVEWVDDSCKEETNRVNVKHILADAEDITIGAILTARINSRRYRGVVKDLLEWSAPKRSRKKTAPEKSAKKAALEGSTSKTALEPVKSAKKTGLKGSTGKTALALEKSAKKIAPSKKRNKVRG